MALGQVSWCKCRSVLPWAPRYGSSRKALRLGGQVGLNDYTRLGERVKLVAPPGLGPVHDKAAVTKAPWLDSFLIVGGGRSCLDAGAWGQFDKVGPPWVRGTLKGGFNGAVDGDNVTRLGKSVIRRECWRQ